MTHDSFSIPAWPEPVVLKAQTRGSTDKALPLRKVISPSLNDLRKICTIGSEDRKRIDRKEYTGQDVLRLMLAHCLLDKALTYKQVQSMTENDLGGKKGWNTIKDFLDRDEGESSYHLFEQPTATLMAYSGGLESTHAAVAFNEGPLFLLTLPPEIDCPVEVGAIPPDGDLYSKMGIEVPVLLVGALMGFRRIIIPDDEPFFFNSDDLPPRLSTNRYELFADDIGIDWRFSPQLTKFEIMDSLMSMTQNRYIDKLSFCFEPVGIGKTHCGKCSKCGQNLVWHYVLTGEKSDVLTLASERLIEITDRLLLPRPGLEKIRLDSFVGQERLQAIIACDTLAGLVMIAEEKRFIRDMPLARQEEIMLRARTALQSLFSFRSIAAMRKIFFKERTRYLRGGAGKDGLAYLL